MDLDELKKSWNTIDERLKKQPLVNEESIERLISYASNNIHAMSRFNYRIRLVSIIIIIASVLFFLFKHSMPDAFYIIIYIAAIPALTWDIYTSYYLSKTQIDEQPISIVIMRFNKMLRWVIYERIIGILFILLIATLFFIIRKLWTQNIGLIIFFIIDWAICLGIVLWIHQKNINKLREIRKNLNELKELKSEE